MTGTLDMSNNLIINIKEPVCEKDAVNKNEMKRFDTFRPRILNVLEHILKEKTKDDVKVESTEPLKTSFQTFQDKVSNILSNIFTNNTKMSKDITTPANVVRVVASVSFDQWLVDDQNYIFVSL